MLMRIQNGREIEGGTLFILKQTLCSDQFWLVVWPNVKMSNASLHELHELSPKVTTDNLKG